MKKKGLLVTLTTITALALFGAACGNSNNSVSKDAIKSGDTSISGDNYAAAAAYYKVATTYGKSDGKAKNYATAANQLASANKKMDNYQLKAALSEAKATSKGTDAINTAKKRLVKKITLTQQTAKAFNHEIALAKKSASNGNTDSALGTINDLLGDKDIQSKPYYRIQIKALELKVSLLKGSTTTTSSNTDSTINSSSSSSSTATTSSSSVASSESDHDDSSATANVTSAEISQARKDLESEGVDVSAWSNSDIAKAVQNAKKYGRTKVTESDMENYQN